MTNDFLLDTNIATAFISGDKNVRRRFSIRVPSLLPFITAAELLYGGLKAGHRDTQSRIIEFLELFAILYPTDQTLKVYAATRYSMDARGSPIPSNDLWLAALALDRGGIVVTNDDHFSRVPGLRTENWLLP